MSAEKRKNMILCFMIHILFGGARIMLFIARKLPVESHAVEEFGRGGHALGRDREHEGACEGDGRDERYQDADAEGERKALHQARAEVKEHDGGDEARDMAVADGEPRPREAVADGGMEIFAGAALFFHALKNEDVCIDCDTERKDEACDASGGKRDAELEYREHHEEVHDERHD